MWISRRWLTKVCSARTDAIPYSKLILRTPKLKVTDAQGQVVFKGRLTDPLAFRHVSR